MNSEFVKNWFRKETTMRAIKVALVVGPVLIFIGQYDLIVNGNIDSKFFLKSILTFLVPYCVSAYSSARAYSSKN